MGGFPMPRSYAARHGASSVDRMLDGRDKPLRRAGLLEHGERSTPHRQAARIGPS
jgi:hypothetical protein